MHQDVRCLIKVLTASNLKLRTPNSQTNSAFSKFLKLVCQIPITKGNSLEKRADANPNENNLTAAL